MTYRSTGSLPHLRPYTLVLFLLGACGGQSVGDAGLEQSADAQMPADGAMAEENPPDAGPTLAGPAAAPVVVSRASFCAGQGSVPAAARGTLASTCTGQLASQLFRYALCTCEDANVGGILRTDAFDSRVGPFSSSAPRQTGGSVGANDTLFVSGLVDIAGSLTVSGARGFTHEGQSSVLGDLRVAGPLAYYGVHEVARDVYLQSDLDVAGQFEIDGALHQQRGAGRSVTTHVTPAGGDLRDDVTVSPPCACDPGQSLDVAKVVEHAQSENDNAEARFSASALSGLIGVQRVELPCGRLYLDDLDSMGALTLVVPGRTALFVAGDLTVQGILNIELGVDGVLDVFVGGTVSLVGGQWAASGVRPGRIRFYVASDEALEISGYTEFVGNLYAPHAEVTLIGVTHVLGSLFAGKLTASGNPEFHYDSSVLAEGDTCTPPTRCEACGDCAASSACVDGMCGSCRTDADCCAPTVCNAGVCGTLLL